MWNNQTVMELYMHNCLLFHSHITQQLLPMFFSPSSLPTQLLQIFRSVPVGAIETEQGLGGVPVGSRAGHRWRPSRDLTQIWRSKQLLLCIYGIYMIYIYIYTVYIYIYIICIYGNGSKGLNFENCYVFRCAAGLVEHRNCLKSPS